MVMTDPVVKARIEDGAVVEAYLVWEVPEHLSSWVTAPIEVGPGWLYDGQTFSPPPAE
jgi:hypothetical protein